LKGRRGSPNKKIKDEGKQKENGDRGGNLAQRSTERERFCGSVHLRNGGLKRNDREKTGASQTLGLEKKESGPSQAKVGEWKTASERLAEKCRASSSLGGGGEGENRHGRSIGRSRQQQTSHDRVTSLCECMAGGKEKKKASVLGARKKKKGSTLIGLETKGGMGGRKL